MFLRSLFGLICACAILAAGVANEESITDVEIPFAEVISHDLKSEIFEPSVERFEADAVNNETFQSPDLLENEAIQTNGEGITMTVETDIHGEIQTATTSSISEEDGSIGRQEPAVSQVSLFEVQLAEKEAEFQTLHVLYQQLTKETELNQIELNEARNKLIAYLEADITKNSAHSEEVNRLNSHRGEVIRENEILRADLNVLKKQSLDASAMMETEVAKNQELQNELSESRESVQLLSEAALASKNRTLISSSQHVLDGALSFFLLTCKALKDASVSACYAVAEALNLHKTDGTDGAVSPLSQLTSMVEVATAMTAVYYVAGSEYVHSGLKEASVMTSTGVDTVAQFYHNTLVPVFHDTVAPQVTAVYTTVTAELSTYYNQAKEAYTTSVHPPIAEFYEANLAIHVNSVAKSGGDFYNMNVKEHYDLHAAPVVKTIVDNVRLTVSSARHSIQKVDLKSLSATAVESVSSAYQSALVYHGGLIDAVLENKDFRDVFGGQAANASALLINSIIAVIVCYLVQFLRTLLRATGVSSTKTSKVGKKEAVAVNPKPTENPNAAPGNSTSQSQVKNGPPKKNGQSHAGVSLHAAPGKK